MRPYLYLAIAIAFEIAGTISLKRAEGFTKLVPSLIVVGGYGAAFYFLSLTLRSLPLGLVYATWSGAGIALIALIGALFFKQTLDAPALIGMALIIVGIVVLNLSSSH